MQVNSLSDIVTLLIAPIKSVLFFHKKKLLFFIIATFLLLIFLFPYSDLTFFAQNKINSAIKSSGSQVTFSELNFNFAPFGMRTEKVKLSFANKAPIEVNELFISPSILSLLRLQPGGNVSAEGIFNGDINFEARQKGKNEENQRLFDAFLNLDKIDLGALLEYFNSPVRLTGKARGELNAEGEESFRKQPTGDFSFTFSSVEVPTEINTPIGPIALPKKIKWSNSSLKGEIDKGRINIKNGTLGTKTSPVNGRYKGILDCPITRRGTNIQASCNKYDIKVELELDKDFENKLAKGFSSLINPREINKKSTPTGGAKYLFSISGGKFGNPTLRSLNKF